jgi:hypothetical protein
MRRFDQNPYQRLPHVAFAMMRHIWTGETCQLASLCNAAGHAETLASSVPASMIKIGSIKL